MFSQNKKYLKNIWLNNNCFQNSEHFLKRISINKQTSCCRDGTAGLTADRRTAVTSPCGTARRKLLKAPLWYRAASILLETIQRFQLCLNLHADSGKLKNPQDKDSCYSTENMNHVLLCIEEHINVWSACTGEEKKKKPVQMNQREKKGHYFERKKKRARRKSEEGRWRE